MKMLRLSILVVAMSSPLQAQTQKDLDERFPASSYEVLPNIMMTPRFSTDDQVCEMSFQKSARRIQGQAPDQYIDDAGVEFIKLMWGSKTAGHDSKAVIREEGDTKTGTYDYDNGVVTIT
jgi:hypothetical protein